MQENEILVDNLDLMPGYHAEQDGCDMRIVDLEGRQVARLPGRAAVELAMPDQEWRGLFERLFTLGRTHAVEYEVLRERMEKLEKRLRELEEERNTSDLIAEDLYEFFSRTARKVASRKRASVEEQSVYRS